MTDQPPPADDSSSGNLAPDSTPTPDSADGRSPGSTATSRTGATGAVTTRGPGQGRPPSSNLTVAQSGALRRLGLVPAGFVLGTVVMQVVSSGGAGNYGAGMGMGGLGGGYSAFGGSGIGTQAGAVARYPCAHMMGYGADHWGYNVEDVAYGASLSHGYETAVSRLRDEARELGAHGVVGIELTVGDLVGGYATWTFRATGTAVTLPGAPPPAEPFTTTITGQHLERLIILGFVPVTLVTGVGACYVRPNCRTRGDYTVPGPVDQISHALGVARDRARSALHAAAQQSGDGAVDTRWSDRRSPAFGEGWIQTAVATGTIVRRFADARIPAAPRPVVPLRP